MAKPYTQYIPVKDRLMSVQPSIDSVHTKVSSPEVLLWKNVLLQAIKDARYVGHKKVAGTSSSVRKKGYRVDSNMLAKEDASNWFSSDGTRIGSLHWVCHVVGMHVDDVRAGIRKLSDWGVI